MDLYGEICEDEATKYPGPYDPGPEALKIQHEIRLVVGNLLDVMVQRSPSLVAAFQGRPVDMDKMDELEAKGQELMERTRQLRAEYKEAVRRYHNASAR